MTQVREHDTYPCSRPDAIPDRRWLRKGGPVRRAAGELALVAILFFAYKLGRVAANGHVEEAIHTAHQVWRFERWLHLPSELTLQHAVIGRIWLIKAANCYYAYVHFPVTAGCLIALYIFRPVHYLHTRRTLAWLTAAALTLHLLMPLAPPRMLTDIGIVDIARVYGPSVYGPPSTDTLTNQYAAMPSLHVAWALALAIALIGAIRSRWRWLALAHPLITLLVVVATGNHYWLDAFAGCSLLALVIGVQAVKPAAPSAILSSPPRATVFRPSDHHTSTPGGHEHAAHA